ncbi:MAG: KEOPS complex subunit Pcc1 [Candidatus Bathyarchaeota archaeon]|nr:KEOPS complex subunit Pcc1 [Candidatus Bathyarchaeota archaeon]
MIREASATLRITYPSEREADIVDRSVRPETLSTVKYRSRVKVVKEGRDIILIFESKDTTALRAAINSYLSWLTLLKSIYSFLEGQK